MSGMLEQRRRSIVTKLKGLVKRSSATDQGTAKHADDFHLDRALHLACNQVTYYLVSGALMVTIPRQDREQLCPRVQAGEGGVYRCLMT